MSARSRGYRLVSVALVLALIAQSLLPLVLPAYADGPAPQGARPPGTSGPPMDEATRQEVERYAQLTAETLLFQPDGTVSLNHAKISRLTTVESERLTRLVSDINTGKIGIAITRQDQAPVVYGSLMALELTRPTGGMNSADNSWWMDGYGVHLYIDPWWTDQLTELVGWAIGQIIGLVMASACASGVGCLVVGVMTSFVWDFVIWRVLRAYFPDSFTIHLPWWGWAGAQVWKSGAQCHGWWFQSWLWT